MAPQPLGLDLNSLKNITAPVLDFPTSATEILTDIPAQANTLTNGWLAMILLSALTIILFFFLNEKSQFNKFRYSDMRSLSIALGVSGVIGLAGLQINYFVDFASISLYVTLYALSAIAISAIENKE